MKTGKEKTKLPTKNIKNTTGRCNKDAQLCISLVLCKTSVFLKTYIKAVFFKTYRRQFG